MYTAYEGTMEDWNSQAAIVIVQETLRPFKKLWEGTF